MTAGTLVANNIYRPLNPAMLGRDRLATGALARAGRRASGGVFHVARRPDDRDAAADGLHASSRSCSPRW